MEREFSTGFSLQQQGILGYDTTKEIIQEKTVRSTTTPVIDQMSSIGQEADELSEDDLLELLEEIQIRTTPTIVLLPSRLRFEKDLKNIDISVDCEIYYQRRQLVRNEYGKLHESVKIVESESSIHAVLQQKDLHLWYEVIDSKVTYLH